MTPVLLANNPTFTRIIGPPGTNPTDPIPQPGGGGGTPDASIYLGVRLNGQYQFDNFGASTADGAPWAANMPFPNAWDTYEANIGKKVSACQWGGLAGSWPPRPFDTTAASAALKRAAFSQYDWGGPAQAMLDILANNQTAKDNFTTLFGAMKTWGKPILFRPIWEMNGTWYPWARPSSVSTTTDAQYIQIWRQIWKYASDVMSGNGLAGSNTGLLPGAPTATGNLSFFFCGNYFYQGAGVSFEPRYPGDAYTDWIGWDAYIQDNVYRSPQANMGMPYDACARLSTTKPFGIGEMGISGIASAPGRAAWFTDFFDNWIPSHPRLKYVNYWEDSGADGAHSWIEDEVPGWNVWKNRIANPKFAANVAANWPFGKIPIP